MARVYLSPPHIAGREAELVAEAIESNWIAPLGPHVDAIALPACVQDPAQGYLGFGIARPNPAHPRRHVPTRRRRVPRPGHMARVLAGAAWHSGSVGAVSYVLHNGVRESVCGLSVCSRELVGSRSGSPRRVCGPPC